MAWVTLPGRATVPSASCGGLRELLPGDHVCLVVSDDESVLGVAADYIGDGLRAGQKVLFFTEALRPQALAAGLEYLGVPAARAQAAGQLVIATGDDGYLASGVFDPEMVIDHWVQEISLAERQGFTALRIAGDMAWAARPVVGAERPAWFEANVNEIFAAGRALALCLYDRRMFTASELAFLAAAHPACASLPLRDGWRPALRMRYLEGRCGLSLCGELDGTNRQAAATTLGRLLAQAPPGGQVLLDLSGLRLADGGGAAMLARAARQWPNLRLTGCTAAVAAVLDLVSGVPAARRPTG